MTDTAAQTRMQTLRLAAPCSLVPGYSDANEQVLYFDESIDAATDKDKPTPFLSDTGQSEHCYVWSLIWNGSCTSVLRSPEEKQSNSTESCQRRFHLAAKILLHHLSL